MLVIEHDLRVVASLFLLLKLAFSLGLGLLALVQLLFDCLNGNLDGTLVLDEHALIDFRDAFTLKVGASIVVATDSLQSLSASAPVGEGTTDEHDDPERAPFSAEVETPDGILGIE